MMLHVWSSKPDSFFILLSMMVNLALQLLDVWGVGIGIALLVAGHVKSCSVLFTYLWSPPGNQLSPVVHEVVALATAQATALTG